MIAAPVVKKISTRWPSASLPARRRTVRYAEDNTGAPSSSAIPREGSSGRRASTFRAEALIDGWSAGGEDAAASDGSHADGNIMEGSSLWVGAVGGGRAASAPPPPGGQCAGFSVSSRLRMCAMISNILW